MLHAKFRGNRPAGTGEEIIIKSLDPLRAKKTFIRKKLGHTKVSAI